MDKPIVLTAKEREALESVALILRHDAIEQEALGHEQCAVLLRNRAKTLETLLARSGGEEEK